MVSFSNKIQTSDTSNKRFIENNQSNKSQETKWQVSKNNLQKKGHPHDQEIILIFQIAK